MAHLEDRTLWVTEAGRGMGKAMGPGAAPVGALLTADKEREAAGPLALPVGGYARPEETIAGPVDTTLSHLDRFPF